MVMYESFFSPTENTKIPILIFLESFCREKPHIAEKGALGSQNAFSNGKLLYEIEESTLSPKIFSKKVTQCRKMPYIIFTINEKTLTRNQ